MKTIYKTIQLDDNNILYFNKKEIIKLDITNDIFKEGIINQLKELIMKYPSDKKRVNYILDNEFIIEQQENQTIVKNEKVTLYISSLKNSVNIIID